jgi:hypothetical protein
MRRFLFSFLPFFVILFLSGCSTSSYFSHEGRLFLKEEISPFSSPLGQTRRITIQGKTTLQQDCQTFAPNPSTMGIKGCALWTNKHCLVFLNTTTIPLFLGHELRHCFYMDFHPIKRNDSFVISFAFPLTDPQALFEIPLPLYQKSFHLSFYPLKASDAMNCLSAPHATSTLEGCAEFSTFDNVCRLYVPPLITHSLLGALTSRCISQLPPS